MLQTMRDNAQGIVAKVIVGLIIVVFALFGVESIVSLGGGEQPVVKVGDYEILQGEIEQRILAQKTELRRQFGDNFDEGLFSESFLQESAIEQLINEKVAQAQIDKLGLFASSQTIDQLITTTPAFQVDGKFDAEQFQTLLRMNNFSVMQYRKALADSIKQNQMQAAISLPIISTSFSQQYQMALEQEERVFSFVEISAKDFESEVMVSDEDLNEYYEKSLDRFQNPERVKIQYILLDKASIQLDEEVTDEDIQLAYQDYIEGIESSEQREASHILFETATHSEGEALALAEDALARINNGESFAEVARELSEDAGSAADGGSLGISPRGSFDPEFEDALYSLELGEVSAPVVTEFGVHLIRADNIVKDDVPSIADIKDELIAAINADQLEALYAEQAQELSNLAFSSDSIEELASVVNLPVKEEGYFTFRQGQGVAADSQLRRTAFEDNMKLDREVSELIETASGAIVFAVSDYEEANAKPLSEVTETVRMQVLADKSLAAAKVQAENIKQGAEADWQTVTESVQGASDTPAPIKELAFSLADSSTDLVKLPAGYAVVRVDGIQRKTWQDMSLEDVDIKANANQLARQEMLSYQAWAKENTNIKR